MQFAITPSKPARDDTIGFPLAPYCKTTISTENNMLKYFVSVAALTVLGATAAFAPRHSR